MEYQRLCTVDAQGRPINKGEWIPYGSNPYEKIASVDKTYYISTFIYNDKHLEQFKKTQSVSGMEDVTTDRLYWDFDSKDDLEKAKADTQEMCARIMQHGIPEKAILVCFSGEKGFSVEVGVNTRLKPEEIKVIASKMAGGLKTFDSSIYDSARILRLPETRHQKSGLYKTPIHLEGLTRSIEDIKGVASEKPEGNHIDLSPVDLPESILELKRTDTKDRVLNATILDPVDLDFKHKMKGFSNCKYAIMNGFFSKGERNHCMMILASTCRANGFPKEIAYNVCKGAARLQAQRTGTDPFSKEEIWSQVIENIYGSKWNGGQYTCKTDEKLRHICESLGRNKCKHTDDDLVVESEDVFKLFQSYALNFEKNALTTGIKPLDDKVKFLVGSSSGILAPPGVGKTSFAFTMLNHNSNKEIPSLFFSYDMHHSLTYLRLLQKHFGLEQEEIFKLVKEGSPQIAEFKEILKEEYKHVGFCFKNGQTPEDINQTIIDTEEKTGKKIKLVVVDYAELVVAETSDPTQASAQVAQKMRQIANEREVATVTLLQPSKLYSDPSEEASTYQAAKGSGAIAQSLTLMLGLSRPGFNPRYPGDDRFFTINCLKSRTGPSFTIDLSWEGLRGNIGELSYEGEAELRQLREKKKVQKAEEEKSW